jgi:two-component system NtrC family sensor kinase
MKCLDNTLLILKNRLESGVEVIKDYGDIPELLCYPGQISQVFMNLIANALDALEDNNPNEKLPKIAIKTEVKTDVRNYCLLVENPRLGNNNAVPYNNFQEKTLEPSQPADTSTQLLTRNPPYETVFDSAYISIRIIDNGSGIPPEIQERIFENFFTTKTHGERNGLRINH